MPMQPLDPHATWRCAAHMLQRTAASPPHNSPCTLQEIPSFRLRNLEKLGYALDSQRRSVIRGPRFKLLSIRCFVVVMTSFHRSVGASAAGKCYDWLSSCDANHLAAIACPNSPYTQRCRNVVLGNVSSRPCRNVDRHRTIDVSDDIDRTGCCGCASTCDI